VSAPPQARRSPAVADRATSTPLRVDAESTVTADDFDFDRRVVSQVDWSIWRGIYNGEFRLAVRCRRCGRWLTHGTSKRNHMGPTCAAKAVD